MYILVRAGRLQTESEVGGAAFVEFLGRQGFAQLVDCGRHAL